MTNVQGLLPKSDVPRIFVKLAAFKNISWKRKVFIEGIRILFPEDSEALA